MATSSRPFLLTGAALASVAAVAIASPAGLPGQIAGVPSPLKLSTAQYDLTALSDITISGITDAVTAGWGGFIGPTDTFYPGEFNNDVKLTGVNGAAYYVLDNALNGVAPYNLENYFFEVGSKGADLITAGLGAVAYVGAGSVFGLGSPVTQVVKSFVSGGGTGGVDISAAILSVTAGIPVVGDLASVYFTGQAAGDATVYGTGFAGVLAYASKLVPGLGNLSNVNLNGLIAGITGFISGVSGLIGGKGSGHSHSESDTEDTEEADDVDTENEHSGNGHSAAAVVAARVAAPAVTAVAPATAVKPATAVTKTASAVAKDVKAPETTEAPEAPEATGAAETVATPDTSGTAETPKVAETPEAPEVAGSDTATEVSKTAAPKRAAQRAQAAQAGTEKAAHTGKRGKANRGN